MSALWMAKEVSQIQFMKPLRGAPCAGSWFYTTRKPTAPHAQLVFWLYKTNFQQKNDSWHGFDRPAFFANQTCSEGYTFSATALYRGVSLFLGSINLTRLG